MVVDNLVWLLGGVMAGYVVGMLTSYAHGRQLMHLAKMRVMADSGRDPMLIEAMEQAPDLRVPAPKKMDGLEDLGNRVRQAYGDDYDVM